MQQLIIACVLIHAKLIIAILTLKEFLGKIAINGNLFLIDVKVAREDSQCRQRDRWVQIELHFVNYKNPDDS